MKATKTLAMMCLWITASILYLLPSVTYAELPELPACQASECYIVATPAKWPEISFEKKLVINRPEISISIPKDPKQIGFAQNSTAIKYDKDNHLIIGKLVNDQFDLPESSFTLFDQFVITFLKTPNDSEPRNKIDNFIWRINLLTKIDMLKNIEKLAYYELRNISVFHIEKKLGNLETYLYIINRSRPNEIITIQGNFKENVFLKIINSIHMKEVTQCQI
jgi:hypothetical protein